MWVKLFVSVRKQKHSEIKFTDMRLLGKLNGDKEKHTLVKVNSMMWIRNFAASLKQTTKLKMDTCNLYMSTVLDLQN